MTPFHHSHEHNSTPASAVMRLPPEECMLSREFQWTSFRRPSVPVDPAVTSARQACRVCQQIWSTADRDSGGRQLKNRANCVHGRNGQQVPLSRLIPDSSPDAINDRGSSYGHQGLALMRPVIVRLLDAPTGYRGEPGALLRYRPRLEGNCHLGCAPRVCPCPQGGGVGLASPRRQPEEKLCRQACPFEKSSSR